MKIKIRRALSSDAEGIIRVNINSWKDTYKGIFPDEFLNSLESKYYESVEKCVNRIDEYIVAIDNSSVVGFIRYGKNRKGYPDEYSEIYAIYVDSNYRGKCIGKKLLEYSFNILKDNYKYSIVSTLITNRSNRFYIKNNGLKIGISNFILLDKEYVENIYRFDLNNS